MQGTQLRYAIKFVAVYVIDKITGLTGHGRQRDEAELGIRWLGRDRQPDRSIYHGRDSECRDGRADDVCQPFDVTNREQASIVPFEPEYDPFSGVSGVPPADNECARLRTRTIESRRPILFSCRCTIA